MAKVFELYNFVLNIININTCASAMDEDLNPKSDNERLKSSFLQPMIPRPLGLG